MPPPVRRSGSGLLQIPRPGLLPSPHYAGFGPLGPLRVVLSTRQSSLSLRPAAALLLASSPGSHPTPENLLPRSSGGLRGRDSHPPVDWPFYWARRNANRNEVTGAGSSIRLGRQEPFRERRRIASTRETKASGDWIGIPRHG